MCHSSMVSQALWAHPTRWSVFLCSREKPLASNVNSPLSKPGSKGYILECSNLHHHNIIITTVLSGTVLHMQSHLIFSATPLAQGQYSNQQMCTLPPISPKEKGLQTRPLQAPWMFDSALFSSWSYGLV
uniref:Uncharacterized protein n=1 Tax=Pipistrellus kuhlii TaxID=59472 RepID=A0A7J7YMM3_PIPKU|nr:hypothetical protein mPipKuh1_010059 [Pipistrellus kuhlii]